jgi:hypothetical protein
MSEKAPAPCLVALDWGLPGPALRKVARFNRMTWRSHDDRIQIANRLLRLHH